MTFSLDFRAHSEIGLVRRNNQDSGYASPTMLVVADGMGGAAAGDLASTVAIREILKADGHRDEVEVTHEVLAGAMARANHTLADLVKADPALDGMGTTVCGALFTGQQLGMIHIGDSRAYLLRGGTLHRLTHDHSWVQSLVDEGKISLTEAATHPHRSLLLKVLNGQPNHEPDLDSVDLLLDDRLLFCSDGLCGFVPDATIRQIITDTPDLDEALAKLVAAAHRGGGADNITVILADVLPHDEALDAREGIVVGAALEGEVPDVEEHTLTGGIPIVVDDLEPEPDALGERVVDDPELGQLEDPETARYAPKAGRKHPWLAALAMVAAVALVVGGGGYGAWHYSRTQYYVGTEGDQVAVFRGIPGSVLGVELGELAESTDIPVADLPRYFQQQVRTTIPVANHDAAQTTVSQLRKRAETCRVKRQQATATPSTSPSPAASATTPSATPTAKGSGPPTMPVPGQTSLLTPASPTAVTSTSPDPSSPPGDDAMEEC